MKRIGTQHLIRSRHAKIDDFGGRNSDGLLGHGFGRNTRSNVFHQRTSGLNERLKLPVLAFEQRVGLGEVGHAHFLGVPLQAFAGKLAGNHTEA